MTGVSVASDNIICCTVCGDLEDDLTVSFDGKEVICKWCLDCEEPVPENFDFQEDDIEF